MLNRYLSEEGFHVSIAEDGIAMRYRLQEDLVDVVLIDLVLPGDNGLAHIQEVRRALPDVGIIVLTDHSDMIDRVIGLETGADDYIAKPFHLREVLAHIRSLLRRIRPQRGEEESEKQLISFDGWCLDLGRRQLIAPDGRDVALTSGEFDLLQVLVSHPQRVLKRDQLMTLGKNHAWGAFSRSVDARIVRLRRKIESDPKRPVLIKSVRNVGYVFAAQVRGQERQG